MNCIVQTWHSTVWTRGLDAVATRLVFAELKLSPMRPYGAEEGWNFYKFFPQKSPNHPGAVRFGDGLQGGEEKIEIFPSLSISLCLSTAAEKVCG